MDCWLSHRPAYTIALNAQMGAWSITSKLVWFALNAQMLTVCTEYPWCDVIPLSFFPASHLMSELHDNRSHWCNIKSMSNKWSARIQNISEILDIWQKRTTLGIDWCQFRLDKSDVEIFPVIWNVTLCHKMFKKMTSPPNLSQPAWNPPKVLR